MPLLPSLYLWCPGYALRGAEELARARSAARALADEIDLAVVESPRLERFAGVGDWHADEDRLGELRAALAHRVLCPARGGYGCIELASHLGDWRPEEAGTLLGYSDLTVLHAWWWRHRIGKSVYGFLPALPHAPRSLATTLAALCGEPMAYADDTVSEVEALEDGQGTGPLFAACLRVLAGLVGTPLMPDLNGTVLAIEDIDERPYRIDRDLYQLHLGGCLAGIRGLISGRFPTAMPAGYAGASAADVIAGWARRLGIPAVFGFPFGHDSDPISLPIGRKATLGVERGVWRLEIAGG